MGFLFNYLYSVFNWKSQKPEGREIRQVMSRLDRSRFMGDNIPFSVLEYFSRRPR
jgi:hypothetical protein